MKHFLIGFIIGFSISMVGAYFITKPKNKLGSEPKTKVTFIFRAPDWELYRVTIDKDTIISERIITYPFYFNKQP